jgi:hypothetical protein
MHRPSRRTDVIRIARSHQHHDNSISRLLSHLYILGATKKSGRRRHPPAALVFCSEITYAVRVPPHGDAPAYSHCAYRC